MSTKAETERAHPTDEWRQGDLISIEYPHAAEGPQLGVIINADCDLEHHKTDGVIAYLALYSFRDFLSEFWFKGHIESVAETAIDRIVDLVRGGSTGRDDLEALMRGLSMDEVAARLRSLEHVKRRDHETIGDQLTKLHICRNSELSFYDRFCALCQEQKDPQKYARAQVEHAKTAMGEGHFFLSELVDRSELGFVVRMRRIYSIAEERAFKSIAAQRSSTTGNDVTAVRIGRLTELYKFKVLQIFAHQFSRVGLPDEITALSSLAIDDLVADILQVAQ